MVPVPVPVLSVPMDAERAFSNVWNGPGYFDSSAARLSAVPESDAPVRSPVRPVETIVWVSVRSGSVNDSVPFSLYVSAVEWTTLTPGDSDVGARSPPTVPLPPANLMVCAPVVMTGTSLVPVIVMVNWSGVFSSSGA